MSIQRVVIGEEMKNIVILPAILVVIMFAVFIFELLIPGNLSWLGIRPRSIAGLPGIILSPFLHGGLIHLLFNSIPLFIMGSLVCALAPSLFIVRTVALVILSGLMTWLISSSGIVIGASGLVFAYWSFLITNAILQKRMKDISIAVITILIYGTLILSLFQLREGVSWAGHFSGFVAGIGFAFIQRRQPARR